MVTMTLADFIDSATGLRQPSSLTEPLLARERKNGGHENEPKNDSSEEEGNRWMIMLDNLVQRIADEVQRLDGSVHATKQRSCWMVLTAFLILVFSLVEVDKHLWRPDFWVQAQADQLVVLFPASFSTSVVMLSIGFLVAAPLGQRKVSPIVYELLCCAAFQLVFIVLAGPLVVACMEDSDSNVQMASARLDREKEAAHFEASVARLQAMMFSMPVLLMAAGFHWYSSLSTIVVALLWPWFAIGSGDDHLCLRNFGAPLVVALIGLALGNINRDANAQMQKQLSDFSKAFEVVCDSSTDGTGSVSYPECTITAMTPRLREVLTSRKAGDPARSIVLASDQEEFEERVKACTNGKLDATIVTVFREGGVEEDSPALLQDGRIIFWKGSADEVFFSLQLLGVPWTTCDPEGVCLMPEDMALNDELRDPNGVGGPLFRSQVAPSDIGSVSTSTTAATRTAAPATGSNSAAAAAFTATNTATSTASAEAEGEAKAAAQNEEDKARRSEDQVAKEPSNPEEHASKSNSKGNDNNEQDKDQVKEAGRGEASTQNESHEESKNKNSSCENPSAAAAATAAANIVPTNEGNDGITNSSLQAQPQEGTLKEEDSSITEAEPARDAAGYSAGDSPNEHDEGSHPRDLSAAAAPSPSQSEATKSALALTPSSLAVSAATQIGSQAGPLMLPLGPSARSPTLDNPEEVAVAEALPTPAVAALPPSANATSSHFATPAAAAAAAASGPQVAATAPPSQRPETSQTSTQTDPVLSEERETQTQASTSVMDEAPDSPVPQPRNILPVITLAGEPKRIHAFDVTPSLGGASPGGRGGFRSCLAHFASTPPKTCTVSLQWAMLHWNIPANHKSCCPWHNSLTVALRLLSLRETTPCNTRWSPLSGWQCERCGSMNHEAIDSCDMCREPRFKSEDGRRGSRSRARPSGAAARVSL